MTEFSYDTILPELVQIGRAILNAPPEAQELAEVAYLETARLLETDFFQLGVFEGSRYRPLIWVRDGNRLNNVTFDLEEGDGGIIGWIQQTGKPLLITDFEQEMDRYGVFVNAFPHTRILQRAWITPILDCI